MNNPRNCTAMVSKSIRRCKVVNSGPLAARCRIGYCMNYQLSWHRWLFRHMFSPVFGDFQMLPEPQVFIYLIQSCILQAQSMVIHGHLLEGLNGRGKRVGKRRPTLGCSGQLSIKIHHAISKWNRVFP